MDCAVCQKPAENQCSACKNVSYCSVECQKSDWKVHKKSCCKKPYVIKTNDDGTEYFEATRDLDVGTIIFDEIPIFQVPVCEKGVKICLSCSIRIDPGAKYQNCSKCSWPICSPGCENLPIHRANECEYLASKKIKCSPRLERHGLMPIASRALMIKKNNKELWDYLQSLGLEDMETGVWEHYDEAVSLLINDFKIRKNVEKKEIKERLRIGHKLVLLSYIKGFARLLYDEQPTRTTIQNPNGKRSGPVKPIEPRDQGLYLYKNAGKMTHSCSPNANWHIGDYPDFKIRIRTIVSIKKGEKLTLSRLKHSATNVLGTIPRSEKLRRDNGFFCKCARCSSPSEFESYFSAIRCDSCFLQDQDKEKKENASETKSAVSEEDKGKNVEDVNSGYLLPVDPMAHEYDGHFYLWKCNRCQKTTPYSKFLIKMMDLDKEACVFYAVNQNFSMDSAKQFIEKYEGSFLHPNHFLLLKTHLKIIECLHNCTAEMIPKVAASVVGSPACDKMWAQIVAQVQDGARRCDFVLNIVNKILPGFSYTKTTTLKFFAFFKKIGRLFLTKDKVRTLDKQIVFQDIEQSRKEMQQLVDFYKNNLPTRRGQENCEEYNYFKSQLDSLEKDEKFFLVV